MPSAIGDLVEQGRQFVNRTLACRKVPSRFSRPIVSFTFDDFPRSAYNLGGTILNQFGIKGTYYVAMSLMGTRDVQGEHFHAEDLEHVVNHGHELGCHTFHHFSCSAHSPEECERSVQQNQEQLEEVLPGYKLRQFSFPFGHVSPTVKKAFGARFTSCRGIYSGINHEQIDLNLLLANRLYERIPMAQVEQLIEKNTAQRGWLVFYTHDIQDHPSPYGCNSQYFERAVQRAMDSGAEVLTISEAISRLQPVGSCKPYPSLS
jgi:peptidoglycan/xylan/chitin deacetylase (PgdA/CDA1 family)